MDVVRGEVGGDEEEELGWSLWKPGIDGVFVLF